MTIKRGDIYYADLSPVVGSEQGGVRPVLIIQNDVGNRFSPTVIAEKQPGASRLPFVVDVPCRGAYVAPPWPVGVRPKLMDRAWSTRSI